MSGRYGPYLKCGKTNYALPKEFKDKEPTLDDALKIINAKNKAAEQTKRGKHKAFPFFSIGCPRRNGDAIPALCVRLRPGIL